MQKLITLIALVLFSASQVFGQKPTEPSQERTLEEVSISSQRENIQRLPETRGTYIWSGKKNEVIDLQSTDANISEKIPRQIFAKVPGVFVYDMDGTGNQTNISTRGLDPHRGWEFNIRANGIMTNSDIYAYPASHFSLPMEALGRIELVRGTGALQYGAQFGGMLNYVIKEPDTTRKFGLETINAAGSYGLLSTFTAIGGKIGKFQYYAYYSQRKSDGYRKNGDSDYDGEGVVLKYRPSKDLVLTATLLRSNYLYHIPGPLTDAQFEADPRQSIRSRNYFNPEIYVPSLAAEWQVGPRTRISWTASAVLGDRNSVQFDRLSTIRDTINKATNAYNGRQVDIDHFHSYTTELRLLQSYSLLGQLSSLATGVQYINNDLNRLQLGKGTTGSDFDLTIDQSGWGRDMHLKTQNIAFFAENKFQLTRQLSVSPGFRIESGESKMTGNISYLPPAEVQNNIKHQFPLFGINGEYTLGSGQNLYAGWSQSYRPVVLKDIIPGNFYERVDKNLKDAYGNTAELGWRGATRHFKWDVTAFSMRYNNRLGTLAQYEGALDTIVLFRTNIGDSRTNGLELFVEYRFHLSENVTASIFTSTAYFDAKYLEGDSIRLNKDHNASIKDNRVESVPKWISRNGVNVKYKGLSISMLYSYTAESYANPLNTEIPSVDGAIGLVPAYGLLDLNATFRASRRLTFRLNFNNIADKQYFTKRPTFYPGPGVWPSDGRSVNASVGLTF